MGCSISLWHPGDDIRLPVRLGVLCCGPRLHAQPSIRRCRSRIGINKLRGDLRWSHLRKCGAQNEVLCANPDGALAGCRKFLLAGTVGHMELWPFSSSCLRCGDRNDDPNGISPEENLITSSFISHILHFHGSNSEPFQVSQRITTPLLGLYKASSKIFFKGEINCEILS